MLDKTQGELLQDLGPAYIVVPTSKWRDTPMYDQACDAARAAFAKSGALLPVVFDDSNIITQEYPRHDRK